ncbi:MAG: hypothetical protein WDO73_13410 [Ignavibacteriota bacterium]
MEKVTSGGQDVPFIQEDKKEDASFYVVMPEAMAKGSAHELRIEYAGDKVVHKAGGGNFTVDARESWYPNVNTFRDHAPYDLTFKVPKQYTRWSPWATWRSNGRRRILRARTGCPIRRSPSPASISAHTRPRRLPILSRGSSQRGTPTRSRQTSSRPPKTRRR